MIRVTDTIHPPTEKEKLFMALNYAMGQAVKIKDIYDGLVTKNQADLTEEEISEALDKINIEVGHLQLNGYGYTPIKELKNLYIQIAYTLKLCADIHRRSLEEDVDVNSFLLVDLVGSLTTYLNDLREIDIKNIGCEEYHSVSDDFENRFIEHSLGRVLKLYSSLSETTQLDVFSMIMQTVGSLDSIYAYVKNGDDLDFPFNKEDHEEMNGLIEKLKEQKK